MGSAAAKGGKSNFEPACKLACVSQNQSEILGKVKGKNVAMVMHHSRNSQQKAWDETLVLALAGMGKLLRAHFPSIATMPDFVQVWPFLPIIAACTHTTDYPVLSI